jgi:hypothetical protein
MRLFIHSVFILVSIFIFVSVSYGKKEDKEGPAEVIKRDLKYIKCDVCERSFANLFEIVADYKKSQNKKALQEHEIQEIIENICKPSNTTTGKWIRSLDIQEVTSSKKKYLLLAEPGGFAKCHSECLTIAKSCEDLFESEIDVDELSSEMWKGTLTTDDAHVSHV